MPDTDSNKEVVTKFYSALNEQDRNALVDCFAADGSAWALGSTLVSGRNKLSDIAKGIDALLESFPSGLCFTILDLIAEDDRVSAKVESTGDHASGCPPRLGSSARRRDGGAAAFCRRRARPDQQDRLDLARRRRSGLPSGQLR